MAVLASLPPGFLCSPFLQLHPQKEDICVCKSPCQFMISSSTLFLDFLLDMELEAPPSKQLGVNTPFFFYTVVLKSHFAKISIREKCKVKDEAGWECWGRDTQSSESENTGSKGRDYLGKNIDILIYFIVFPPNGICFLLPQIVSTEKSIPVFLNAGISGFLPYKGK